ncbi:MAG: PAS domain S-box protein [Chloroflexi bacterium]|nr:PAS domain S-box protein [Chloroflexota bacterium]
MDYEQLLNVVATRVAETTGDACTVRLLSEDGRWLRPVAAHHPDPELAHAIWEVMGRTAARADAGVWQPVIEGQRTVRVPVAPGPAPPDASEAQADFMRRHPMTSIMGAPLLARGRVIGGLSLVRYGQGELHTPEDELFLRDLADRAALAIDNARLYREAQDEIAKRERAEAALRESEERFRATFEQAAVGLAHVGLDGRWLRFNRRLGEIVGYAPEELLGLSFQDITHPEDLEADLDQARRLLEGAIPSYSMAKRYLRKDGSTVWVNLTGSLVRDATGAPQYFIAVVEDIDRRKQAEEALRASERLHRTFISHFPNGSVVVFDHELRYRIAGGEGLAAVGLTADALEGKTPGDVFPPEVVATAEPQYRRALAGEHVVEEVSYAGRVYWTHALPIYDETGQVAFGMVLTQDITERKHAEAEVRRQQAFLKQVINTAPSLIFAKDWNGRFVLANQAVADAYGTTVERLVGKSDADFNGNDEEVTSYLAADRFVMTTRQPQLIPEEPLTDQKTGAVRWLQTIKVPLESPDDQTPHVLGVATDITERKTAEDALREANARLQAALNELTAAQERLIRQEQLRALGEMASGIAHDFNNALAVIAGYTELLLTRSEFRSSPAVLVQHLQLILLAARDAGAVVDRLREFYRAREADEAFVPVNLNDLIAKVISLTRPRWKDQAQAAGITIHLETDLREIPSVAGREVELREALTNLIFNAVDALPDGGTITLRTRSEGEHVVAEVSDTGAGMPPEVRARAFEPFFTTKGERGTGLGLAMVHGIVRRHGGTIDLDSQPGEGTTFALRLPATAAEDPKRDEAPAAGPAPLRVLVAEDEPSLRTILCAYLGIDRHAVETARDGREALALFERGGFDLVLTDRAMPGLGGDELAAAIKGRAPGTPVIMLTGLGGLMQAVGERPEGVDLILSKPVRLAELRAAIARVTASVGGSVDDG